jgi:hypothetical protein
LGQAAHAFDFKALGIRGGFGHTCDEFFFEDAVFFNLAFKGGDIHAENHRGKDSFAQLVLGKIVQKLGSQLAHRRAFTT